LKENCWEVKKCGRGVDGAKSLELGVCLAATESRLNGVHGGKNAGRACWAVAGTLCGGIPQGTFAQKEESCVRCEFYKQIRREEGRSFRLSGGLLELLH